MMADSIEHVISYWMLFQKFQSPALAGFAIIAHWLPTLIFGVYAGALADKYDPRRLIQIGMVLFMICSLTWGILFTTGWLEWWHAIVILTVHGIASVFWGTPEPRLILHDIVGREKAAECGASQCDLALSRTPCWPRRRWRLDPPSAWPGARHPTQTSPPDLPLILWLWKAPYLPEIPERSSAAAARCAASPTL